MKRYKMEIGNTPDSVIVSPRIDGNGEWVRYKDVADSLRAAYQNGYNKSTIDNQGISRCNCKEYCDGSRGYDWICPAHGYKKR